MVTYRSLTHGRPDSEVYDINKIRSIRIGLASPDQIREWSHGEVKNPETIDYKTHKPKMDGLFCERIFGPTKDYECACGKYKGSKHKNVVCDRCGVEVIPSRARRARLGHIELQMPVAHIWFTKGVPSRMATVVDITLRALEKVIYYEEYMVVDAGDTQLKVGQILSEVEYLEAREQYGNAFKAGMGAEAVAEVLRGLDLDALAAELRNTVNTDRSQQRIKKAIKRLKVVEDFRNSHNRPEWMVMEVLPVIPPDLRPLVPLDGGRFATSDLNDLYRRVINRNNRLRRLKEVRAPEVIIRNEKRMLQEAVDALLDNGRRGRPVKGSNNRPLKSLSDMLKGKQGRFRQNLLGKRVDYSGRSVIVVGPKLKFHQCGLPKKMALELFEPFIIRRLEEMEDVNTIRSAKRKIEREEPEVFAVLEEVIQDHPVLLNRAPTLHRLGIQAFQPVLVEGKAIQLHPLACSAFNADFDGDQMAVHVPLSREARAEAKQIMLSTRNILSPSNGKPLAAPTQDIVLGCYYLTKVRPPKLVLGEDGVERPLRLRRFSNPAEAISAYENEIIGLQEEIEVRIPDDPELEEPLTRVALANRSYKRVRTTVGRIIFNECLPPVLGFVNRLMTKKALGEIVLNAYRECGEERTARFLDELKDLGFQYAKVAGISMSLSDLLVPTEKGEIIAKARQDVNEIHRLYQQGSITDHERYHKTINTWIDATDRVAEAMMRRLETHNEGFNPVFIMAESGARGNKAQIKQLAGMRGLMSRPTKKLTGAIGETIESPIESNFKEGLTVLEYFISTHGARKGLADTALKTAEAGYLTRRLVDVAQDIIITEYDCGTVAGMEVVSLSEGDELIEPLGDRIVGRVVQEDVRSPLTGELIARTGDVIDEDIALAIERSGIERVTVRSVLYCEASRGVCSKCYGWDMTRRALVLPGEAVGVMAAQSIGEPGTQLTLRTFHIGGTTSKIVEQSEIAIAAASERDSRGLNEGEIGLLRYIGLRTGVSRNDQLIAISQGARPMLARSGIQVTQLAGDEQGKVVLENCEYAPTSDGERRFTRVGGSIHVRNAKGKVVQSFHNMPRGGRLLVDNGDKVAQMQELALWDPYSEPTLAGLAGTARLVDIVEDRTLKVDAEGRRTIIGSPTLRPRIVIEPDQGDPREIYLMPGQYLLIEDGQKVLAGDVVARIVVPVLAAHEGKCRFYDLIEGTTVERHLDPITRTLVSVVKDYGPEYRPRVTIVNRRGEVQSEHYVPSGAYLIVEDGEDVFEGDILARTGKIVQQFRELPSGIPVGAEILMPPQTRVERVKGNTCMVLESGRRLVQSIVARWDPISRAEVAGIKGKVRYEEIVPGVTLRMQRGGTGEGQKTIMEHKEDRHPAIVVVGEGGREEVHPLPTGANVVVENGQEVNPGDSLARIPRETFRSRDVTAGLPRVEEIFEARRPKPRDLAIISKIDGYVLVPNEEQQKELEEQIVAKMGKRRRKGARMLLITNREGTEVFAGYDVEAGRHVIVQNGEFVARGDKLVDGSIDPHEYLEVMGEKRAAEWLLNEVQEVYRLQGVAINDKHIEVIVRQMLRKVVITDPGDTHFLTEDLVDKQLLMEENLRVENEGGKPAKHQAKLLGITKASLGTESFISAASFQETTRVLTQAAIAGREDLLLGLKENVIMGHLIPAGTGKPEFLPLRIRLEEEEPPAPPAPEAEAEELEEPLLSP